jgi:hypothetical protein
MLTGYGGAKTKYTIKGNGDGAKVGDTVGDKVGEYVG